MHPDNKMHPDDKRNLIVFMLAAFALFAAYDIFIKQPYDAKLRAYQEAQREYVSQNPQAETEFYLLERDKALTTTPRVAIDTPTLAGSLNLYGARIDDLSLKAYYETIDREKNVTLLDPANTEFTHYAEFGWVGGGQGDVPGSKALWSVKGNKTLSVDNPVTLTWRNGSDLIFERVVSIDENYMFTITDTVKNAGSDARILYPYALVTRQGQPREKQGAYIMHEGPVGYIGEELQEFDFEDLEEQSKPAEFKSDKGWIGMTQKYWLAAVIPDHAESQERTFRFLSAKTRGEDRFNYQTDVTGAPVRLSSGDSATVTQRFFAGPKKVRMLDAYERDFGMPHFDLAVDFGMFFFLTKPFFYGLTWLGHELGSFAIALLIFTVGLRLLVFPLANKSYRSFAGMRKVGPKIKELREKFGDDRQKLQQAIFELYKKENVNPMAGCLPILVQIPIFFALYKVLFITIEMRHTPFFGWIQDMSAPDPTAFLNLFGLLPFDVPGWLSIGAWPLIMGATMMLQMRLSPAPQDPVQKQIQMFMPILFTLFLARFPAGLVIYWSWSNTLALIQQYTIMRMMGVKVNIFTRSQEEKEMDEAVEKGPAVHPEFEEIKEDIEGIFDGEDDTPKEISPPKKKRPKKKK